MYSLSYNHTSIFSEFIHLWSLPKIMNSLFSFITTLYALVLLYFPSFFSDFILSPAVFSALILLLYLLRLGAAQRSAIKQTKSELEIEEFDGKKRQSFVEWDVRAPLEVIYEEYEGDDDDANLEIRQYASLSLFYPESDSDSSSEGHDRDRDGLIEIALDDKKRPTCEVDEDNLIEIDLSPERYMMT